MEEQATQLIANTNAFVLQMYDLLIRYSVSTLGALIILCVGWILAGILQKWTIQSLSKIRGFDQTLVGFFGAVVRYSILVIILVMVLGQFGVQTASILAALGAIGLAIGLALQGTLQNIAAGIMILVNISVQAPSSAPCKTSACLRRSSKPLMAFTCWHPILLFGIRPSPITAA